MCALTVNIVESSKILKYLLFNFACSRYILYAQFLYISFPWFLPLFFFNFFMIRFCVLPFGLQITVHFPARYLYCISTHLLVEGPLVYLCSISLLLQISSFAFLFIDSYILLNFDASIFRNLILFFSIVPKSFFI